MTRLIVERCVERDEIRLLQQLFQGHQFNTWATHRIRGHERIMGHDSHVESAHLVGHPSSDVAKGDQAQRENTETVNWRMDFRSRFLARVHVPVEFAYVTCGVQQ